MRMRAMVVKDVTESRVPKNKTEAVEYRNLSVIDQDNQGATLETFIRVSVPVDTNKKAPLVGAIVVLAFSDLGENGFGVNGRAQVETVEGQMVMQPKKAA